MNSVPISVESHSGGRRFDPVHLQEIASVFYYASLRGHEVPRIIYRVSIPLSHGGSGRGSGAQGAQQYVTSSRFVTAPASVPPEAVQLPSGLWVYVAAALPPPELTVKQPPLVPPAEI
jgi:hypothetical protein